MAFAAILAGVISDGMYLFGVPVGRQPQPDSLDLSLDTAFALLFHNIEGV